MLTHELDSSDLNSEKMTKFDGTMIYAQNKRQQLDFLIKYNLNVIQ